MATSPRATVLVGDDEALLRRLPGRAFLLPSIASSDRGRTAAGVRAQRRDGG